MDVWVFGVEPKNIKQLNKLNNTTYHNIKKKQAVIIHAFIIDVYGDVYTPCPTTEFQSQSKASCGWISNSHNEIWKDLYDLDRTYWLSPHKNVTD